MVKQISFSVWFLWSLSVDTGAFAAAMATSGEVSI
jgi:hypothetical protein